MQNKRSIQKENNDDSTYKSKTLQDSFVKSISNSGHITEKLVDYGEKSILQSTESLHFITNFQRDLINKGLFETYSENQDIERPKLDETKPKVLFPKKIIQVKFDRYIVQIELTEDGKFIGIQEIQVNKDFRGSNKNENIEIFEKDEFIFE
ncbi:hypothetical protein [Candidatus Lokiarchaeum ossiferum]|uniref:hypothetical protein n=1 Tax=Candidatus Lokiarchaeum ossiferum TaxID=2951803 RepID=UPI00352FEC16